MLNEHLLTDKKHQLTYYNKSMAARTIVRAADQGRIKGYDLFFRGQKYWLCPCSALSFLVMSHSTLMFNGSDESRHSEL